MFSLRTALPVVAGLASAALLVPAAATSATALSAAPSAAQVPGPRSAVTWSGWRGVDLGTTLAAAHRRLGGHLQRTSTGGGCGDVLVTRTGSMDGNVYRHPHAVGTIKVEPGIAYPLGVDQTMTPKQVTRAARHSDFILRTTRVATPGGGHESENRVVGPRGATLYFSYAEGSRRIDRMGLAVNRSVALQQMEINGC